MLVINNVSQSFLRAKPNHHIVVWCFIDGERVLSILVGKYLTLVDKVIITTIPYASDSCRRLCQGVQCVVLLVGVVGVMINLLKYSYLLIALHDHLFALLNWN
jgi:hypothetical protein